MVDSTGSRTFGFVCENICPGSRYHAELSTGPAVGQYFTPRLNLCEIDSDPSPHKAEWNAEPLGFMQGADNLSFFLFGRDHIIDFIKNTSYDLKAHFTYRWGDEKRRSIHALMFTYRQTPATNKQN